MKNFVPFLLLIMSLATVSFAQTESADDMPELSLFEAQIIPRNSRVYIAPFKSEDTEKPVEGFETYMAAALRKKNVPLLMVNDRSKADFEIVGSADRKGAGFAKKWLLGDFRGTTSASLTVTNLHTGVVAYADASHRASANKGLRSSAEKLAKYLKRKIENDEKKGMKAATYANGKNSLATKPSMAIPPQPPSVVAPEKPEEIPTPASVPVTLPPVATSFVASEQKVQAPEPEPVSTISVKSTPDGADIEVDGKYVGSTPSTVQLRTGDHKIAVKKKGFMTWERTLKLSPGGNIVVDASLEKEAPPPPAIPVGGGPTLSTKPLRPAPAR